MTKQWITGLMMALTLGAAHAASPNWKFMGTDVNGGDWYVDTNSIMVPSNSTAKEVWFWTRFDLNKNPYNFGTSKAPKWATQTLTRYHASCTAKQYISIKGVAYDKNGNSIHSASGSDASYGYGAWEAVIPGTVFGDTIDVACAQVGF
jgi:hypothetical protein